MKKLFLIPATIIALALASCNAEVNTDENVGVGANAGTEALETLSEDTTAMKANPNADSSMACTCEHGCKTKEECVQNCGEGCGMLKE